MKQLTDPEALADSVRDDVGREYKLPVARLLIGDVSEATATVSRELSLPGNESNEGVSRYREFASAFFDTARRRSPEKRKS